MTDTTSLQAAFEGAHGVFSVQHFWLPGVQYDGEIEQGRNVADVAEAVGVQHFVYTSVGAAERNTGVPHFDNESWPTTNKLGCPLL